MLNRLTITLLLLGSSGLSAAADSNRGAADSRTGRSHLIEGNLRDINRSMQSTLPTATNVPRRAVCGYCGDRAELPEQKQRNTLSSAAELQTSLHRLHREVRERATPHTRKHVVEEKLAPPPPG